MESKEVINSWRDALLSPGDKDVLVNVFAEKSDALELALMQDSDSAQFSLGRSIKLSRVLKCSRDYKRDSGIDSLGISSGVLHFDMESKSFATPIFIASAKIDFNKFLDAYELKASGDFLFNPFLQQLFGLPDELQSLEELETFLDELKCIHRIENRFFLANFHPYRFALVKELEGILNLEGIPDHLRRLIGDGEGSDSDFIGLHKGLLFPTNSQQDKVFETIEREHCVIQGPPGTGKSQVIANLIGKAIGNDKSVLLVSEKNVALGVVLDKLKVTGLDTFCLLNDHKVKKSEVISSLEKTWRFLDELGPEEYFAHGNSNLMLDGLNLLFSRLGQDGVVGGLSFSAFRAMYPEVFIQNKMIDHAPSLSEWETDKAKLCELDGVLLKNKMWCFIEFQNFESTTQLRLVLQELEGLCISLNIRDKKWKDVEYLIRLSSSASYFFYDGTPLLEELLLSKKKAKEFHGLVKTLEHLTEKIALLREESLNWKDELSLSQLMEFLSVMTKNDRFSLGFWRTKAKLAKLQHVGMEDVKPMLQRLIVLKTLQNDQVEVKAKLRSLGVEPDLIVLKQIELLLGRLHTMETNVYQEILGLSVQQRSDLLRQSSEFNRLVQLVKQAIDLSDNPCLYDVVGALLNIFPALNDDFLRLRLIQSQTRRVLRISEDLVECERIIVWKHWSDFKSMNPELAEISGDRILNRVSRIIEAQDEEFVSYASGIVARVKKKFDSFHRLLEAPARKLSPEDKVLKQQLRTGKSILVKEFAKSRNHKSFRELLDSEASVWIHALKPVVMATPYTVAKSLPLQTDLYDVVVFDEASQIPLHYAAGSILRGKRVVVAGDSQQMAPSFFFKKTEDVAYADLLHHASFYWKNIHLVNHYRSNHPELIGFSNRYFYKNELVVYPKYPKKRVVDVVNVSGNFVDRVNLEEAKYVASELIRKISDNQWDFGLVAFSEKQLDTILSQLPKDMRVLLMERESEGFFVRTLENVQGEECDHLIISLGYGYDRQGKFAKHFGPINRGGGHKRLNVLMSRARQKITFVKSVNYGDFDISINPGVEMLRKLVGYLDQIGTESTESDMAFSHLNISSVDDQLVFDRPHECMEQAIDLVDYIRVFSNRGWNIQVRI